MTLGRPLGILRWRDIRDVQPTVEEINRLAGLTATAEQINNLIAMNGGAVGAPVFLKNTTDTFTGKLTINQKTNDNALEINKLGAGYAIKANDFTAKSDKGFSFEFGPTPQSLNTLALDTAILGTWKIGETKALSAQVDGSEILGTWIIDSVDSTVMMTFFQDGSYIITDADSLGIANVESGLYLWDSLNGAFTVTVIADTKSIASSPYTINNRKILISNNELSIYETNSDIPTKIAQKFTDSVAAIIGTWYADSSDAKLIFAHNNSYIYIQDGALVPADQVGTEFGTYVWDSSTGALFVDMSVDGNSLSGFSEALSVSATILADILTTNADGKITHFTKIPSDISLDTAFDVSTTMLTFFNDSTYIITETDSSAIANVETGTYTWDSSTGAFEATVLADTKSSLRSPYTLNNIKLTVLNNELSIFGSDTLSPVRVAAKVTGAIAPIIGAWYLGNDKQIIFAHNNNYIYVQDTSTISTDLIGSEIGTYAWDQDSGLLTVGLITDGNGISGLQDSSSIIAEVVSNSLSITADSKTSVFTRKPSSLPIVNRFEIKNSNQITMFSVDELGAVEASDYTLIDKETNFKGTITKNKLTDNRTWTFPDKSGAIAIVSSSPISRRGVYLAQDSDLGKEYLDLGVDFTEPLYSDDLVPSYLNTTVVRNGVCLIGGIGYTIHDNKIYLSEYGGGALDPRESIEVKILRLL